jgi:hypothetical protein
MTDEAWAERKSILLRVDRWMQQAAKTGDAETAMLGMLNEIDTEERRKVVVAGAIKVSRALTGRKYKPRKGSCQETC